MIEGPDLTMEAIVVVLVEGTMGFDPLSKLLKVESKLKDRYLPVFMSM